MSTKASRKMRDLSIYREYFGINEDQQRIPVGVLSRRYSLTRGRVYQIIDEQVLKKEESNPRIPADLFKPAVVDSMMKYLTDINPDWPGGLIYFPSVSATTGYWTKEEVALKRAKAVVLSEDGYNNREIASTLGVSAQTVVAWKAKYGADVRAALAKVRGGDEDKAQ